MFIFLRSLKPHWHRAVSHLPVDEGHAHLLLLLFNWIINSNLLIIIFPHTEHEKSLLLLVNLSGKSQTKAFVHLCDYIYVHTVHVVSATLKAYSQTVSLFVLWQPGQAGRSQSIALTLFLLEIPTDLRERQSLSVCVLECICIYPPSHIFCGKHCFCGWIRLNAFICLWLQL